VKHPDKAMTALVRRINAVLKPKGEKVERNPHCAGVFRRLRFLNRDDGCIIPMTKVTDDNVDPVKVARELGIK
jgi:hypothetical protein